MIFELTLVTLPALTISSPYFFLTKNNNITILISQEKGLKLCNKLLPIKDSNVLKEVQDTLLNNFKAGRRNYTVFQVGKATLLRVSDVMRLKQTDIFNPDGSIKQNAFIHDRKTGKPNTLNQFKQSSYCTVNGYLIID